MVFSQPLNLQVTWSTACRKMADDLNDRGIRASFFFQTYTLPKSDLADDLLKSGHSIGLHAVQTQNFSTFLKELDKISKMFNSKVYGFTKHGSGETYYRFHAIFKGVNN